MINFKFAEYLDKGNQLAEDRDAPIMKIENYKLQFLELTQKENSLRGCRHIWQDNVTKAYEKIVLLLKYQ